MINLTPHSISVWSDAETHVVTIPASGLIARVSVSRTLLRVVDGVPIYATTTGDVVGLPGGADGVSLIVSAMVRCALPGRKDLLSPGDLLRNDKGQPVGCLGLVANP